MGNRAAVPKKPPVKITPDFSKRPIEDAKDQMMDQQVSEHFKKLSFSIKTTTPVIHPSNVPFQTLQNRQNQPVMEGKLPPGKLLLNQLYEIFGLQKAQQLDQQKFINQYQLNEKDFKSLLSHYNIYETIGTPKTGIYGTWATTNFSKDLPPSKYDHFQEKKERERERQYASDNHNDPLWKKE